MPRSHLFRRVICFAFAPLLLFVLSISVSQAAGQSEDHDRPLGPVSNLAHDAISFALEGTRLVASSGSRNVSVIDVVGGTVWIIDPETGEALCTYDLDVEYPPILIEISPIGTQYLHNDSAAIVLRDLRTGTELHRFVHDTSARAARFSADGGLVPTSGGDSTARLWDVKTGEKQARYIAHRSIVPEIAFLPGGQGY